MPYQIDLKFTLTDDFLMDVMTTMVESGGQCLWYWYDFELVDVHRREGDLAVMEFTYRCENPNEDGVLTGTITPLKVAKAIETVLGQEMVNSTICEYIIRGVKDNDAGDIDADAADCIAQVIAFGEVVYG